MAEPLPVAGIAGLITLPVILVLAFWFKRRKPGQAPASPPGPSATATVVPTATPRTPAEPSGGFDPDATQMYMRPGNAAAPQAAAREGSQVSGARLVGLSGSQKGQDYVLSEAGLTIGRNPASDVVLSDSRVSGRHAWIGLVDGKAILRDLGSSNGTFINTGARVTDDTPLCHKDTIFIGGHQGDQFRFVAE